MTSLTELVRYLSFPQHLVLSQSMLDISGWIALSVLCSMKIYRSVLGHRAVKQCPTDHGTLVLFEWQHCYKPYLLLNYKKSG